MYCSGSFPAVAESPSTCPPPVPPPDEPPSPLLPGGDPLPPDGWGVGVGPDPPPVGGGVGVLPGFLVGAGVA